ncbi:CAP domain-containing protein [Cypionkella sinensis]|uniref:CAP domain-containing protein n=1 Tax=Cypionkella sinensis TaxID=1756043 RepID=A0ABV7IY78_9RHOB
MALTAAEQYLLELINRARLDPAAEAARYGIDLNAGLAAGTISTASRQVLAPNALLENAAIGHSQWMLAADVFSHTGSGGSSAAQRVTATGYGWSNVAENLSWRGTSGTIDLNAAIATHHQDLFLSAGHRANMMNGVYQEVGLAQERGLFNNSGRNYDSSMLTEVFGRPATATVFLTGVVYNDSDRNAFYSIGEGVAGATFTAQGHSATSQAAGGYALALTAGAAVAVTGQVGTISYAFTVGMGNGNVKVDIVNQSTILTSGSVTLNLGINNLTLLGNASLNAGGNGTANVMTGNAGNNRMDGAAGNDRLLGMNGNDYLIGGSGHDTIIGGNGADRIDGGTWNDRLTGEAGADTFIFANNFGLDTIADFSRAAGDRLTFDDQIWGGTVLTAQQVVAQFAHVVAGGVTFEFSANEVITLTGLTSTAGLADALTIV